LANTIDTTFFFGRLNVAQKSDATVSNNLQALINELEPVVLTSLMGYELYRDYKAGIAAGTPDAKWLAIRDGQEYTNRSLVLSKWNGLKFTSGTANKSLIANYVYWYWQQNEASNTTGTGEKIAANQNAVASSPAQKMMTAWNEMVDMNFELIEFLMSNQDIYPQFLNHYSQNLFFTWVGFRRIGNSLLVKQNLLGI
jgi:hypothetical protein